MKSFQLPTILSSKSLDKLDGEEILTKIQYESNKILNDNYLLLRCTNKMCDKLLDHINLDDKRDVKSIASDNEREITLPKLTYRLNKDEEDEIDDNTTSDTPLSAKQKSENQRKNLIRTLKCDTMRKNKISSKLPSLKRIGKLK